jgi:hypothetical protein
MFLAPLAKHISTYHSEIGTALLLVAAVICTTISHFTYDHFSYVCLIFKFVAVFDYLYMAVILIEMFFFLPLHYLCILYTSGRCLNKMHYPVWKILYQRVMSA